MRGILTLLLIGLAFGVIEEAQIDPSLIEEKIETNCPADPTFGGKCNLVETKVPEGQECREVNGVRICRDWWKKEYTYRCNGNLDFETFLSSLSGQEYCTYEKECLSWREIPKNGGIVSCRVYYDKNKPGCDSNPQRPECLNDDCGELFEKCTLLNYTSYSDIKDKANTEPQDYCDPVYGYCGQIQVPSVSGVNVGIYTFECPSDVRKVCTDWRITKKCPDGTQTLCNTVRVCKKLKSETTLSRQIKSCIVSRPYREYRVIKGSEEAENLRNNPACVKVSEVNTPCNSTVRTYGDVSICELAGRHSRIGGNSGSITVQRGVEVPAGTDLVLYLYVGNSCDDDNTLVDLIVKDSNTKQVIGEYHNICNHPGRVITIYSNVPEGLKIDFKYRVAHCIGVRCGQNDYTFSDDETSKSWNYGGDTWDSHESTFGWRMYTFEVFRCYENRIDLSSCDLGQNCNLIDDVSNLENLACYDFDVDVDNPQKMICSKYSVNYECEENLNVANCEEWETKTVCNSNDIVIPDLNLNENDFSSDFAKAVAFAQSVNELKHVWSGEPKVCEDGWWNSIVDNPTDYFVNKMISMGIAYFGSALYDVIKQYVQAASFCLSPGATVAGATGVGDCMYTVAQSSYATGGSPMQDLFNKICGNQNATSLCDKATFLANPWVQFGISLAVDIITSTEKCNSCTSEGCAVRHNDYQEYVLISKGLCHYVGSKCSWKIDLGISEICLRRAYKYCCYNSKFARILVEQAYKQLGYSFGDYDNPNCSALTFDDLKRLDFSRMDFSELINEIQAKMQYKVNKEYIENKIENFYEGTEVSPSGEVPWSQ